MEVRFEHTFVIRGAPPGDEEWHLPVTVLTVEPFLVAPGVPLGIDFNVKNNTEAPVIFPDIEIEVDGSGSHKVTATILDNSMALNPNVTMQNQIIIEANEALEDDDEIHVRLKGRT